MGPFGQLPQAHFTDADLRRARFTRCDLGEVRMRAVELGGARIDGTWFRAGSQGVFLNDVGSPGSWSSN
ncbi:pentapeptide repeat-containing protein [Glutamicibacter sp. V16R2B1]|uniref:pentapeptide repeat-containing protein n=1 Tax=Glutamicibacter sp. V16R2B1 TaxID=2036207 RepID=UPI001484F04C|nr:pentapeptide repeat-containing protein [Glutamicibacter sp. V16R2B1]